MAPQGTQPSSNGGNGNFEELIAWVNKKLTLLDTPVTWNEEANISVLEFLTGTGSKTLSIIKNESTESSSNATYSLLCDPSGKTVAQKNLCAYFLRSGNELTIDTINTEVQYGSVGTTGLNLTSFERMMKGLVDKQVSQNESLTVGAQNDLSGHYHRCMATLTDTIHHIRKTVLYCPDFPFNNPSEAALNKDLVQIMESVVIHWTRQIKDIVNNQDTSQTQETSGPLDEIEF